MDGFTSLGFFNCPGVTDGTYMVILSPAHHGYEFNWKNSFSIVLKMGVDRHDHFMHLHARWSGRVHSVRIFRSSILPELKKWREYAPSMSNIQVEGKAIPPLLTGDDAYLLHFPNLGAMPTYCTPN